MDRARCSKGRIAGDQAVNDALGSVQDENTAASDHDDVVVRAHQPLLDPLEFAFSHPTCPSPVRPFLHTVSRGQVLPDEVSRAVGPPNPVSGRS